MKIVKKIAVILLIGLVVAQFFRPEKNDGNLDTVNTFLAETNPPENVTKILKSTCFDCHSEKTIYPWYNNITPINFWLKDHIDHGKEHLNFSKWSEYSLKKKEHKMDELYEEVAAREMPLDSYTWTHADANLTQEEIDAVVAWGKKVQAEYKAKMSTE